MLCLIDFMTCSAHFNIQSEGLYLSFRTQYTVGRYNLVYFHHTQCHINKLGTMLCFMLSWVGKDFLI